MELTTNVVPVTDLTTGEKAQMLALMQRYYEGVDPDQFTADLEEKGWAVISRVDSAAVLAFSTLSIMRTVIRGISISAFYSGDTIVDRAHWGSWSHARCWIRFVFSRIARAPEYRWYWFLICKGYRTYRYLPVYFQRYTPAPTPAEPFEQAVLDALACGRFGGWYDRPTGLVRYPTDYRLRPGIGDITEKERRNPDISFFEQLNPDWIDGTELACLAELHRDNLKPAALRLLGDRETICG